MFAPLAAERDHNLQGMIPFEDAATVVSQGHGSQGDHSVYIPSATIDMWFSPETYENSIHELEQDSLPEFFIGRYPSKTPQVYMEYRNFMI